MRVVITGGLGFIGQHLGRALVGAGHDVLAIDSLSPQIHGDLPSTNAPLGVKVARLDVCRLADHPELIEGADVVFHLAAETGTAQSMYQMSHYTRVNCEGTSALLEAAAKCSRRPRQVILASSRSVYGEGAYVHPDAPGRLVAACPRSKSALDAGDWEPRDAQGRTLQAVPTPEALPFSPGSVYAATKAAQELLLNSASAALGMRSTVLRFQNVYGEGQSLLNPYTGIISIFFNRARQGLHIPAYEDGAESRDFVHVSDVVRALTQCMENPAPDGVVLNVGSGVATSVSHLAQTLLRAAGLDVPVQVTGQYRLGDIRHCFADLELATRHLGFTPQVSLEEGLRRFCAWAATQPVHADKSAQAEAELRAKGLAN